MTRTAAPPAGVPANVGFRDQATAGPAHDWEALDAGVLVSFVTGDEFYGLDPALRARLRQRGVGYILAIARNQPRFQEAYGMTGLTFVAGIPRVWAHLKCTAGDLMHLSCLVDTRPDRPRTSSTA